MVAKKYDLLSILACELERILTLSNNSRYSFKLFSPSRLLALGFNFFASSSNLSTVYGKLSIPDKSVTSFRPARRPLTRSRASAIRSGDFFCCHTRTVEAPSGRLRRERWGLGSLSLRSQDFSSTYGVGPSALPGQTATILARPPSGSRVRLKSVRSFPFRIWRSC